MSKSIFATALTLALAVSGTAFAQSKTTAANPPPAADAAQQQKANASAPTVKNIMQDLQKAGFSDVKVLEDAFLVQAKTKDGNPIIMTIGPNGVSALELSNPSGAAHETTGQASPNNNSTSAPAKPAPAQH
jgi:hypothetical protein